MVMIKKSEQERRKWLNKNIFSELQYMIHKTFCMKKDLLLFWTRKYDKGNEKPKAE